MTCPVVGFLFFFDFGKWVFNDLNLSRDLLKLIQPYSIRPYPYSTISKVLVSTLPGTINAE